MEPNHDPLSLWPSENRPDTNSRPQPAEASDSTGPYASSMSPPKLAGNALTLLWIVFLVNVIGMIVLFFVSLSDRSILFALPHGCYVFGGTLGCLIVVMGYSAARRARYQRVITEAGSRAGPFHQAARHYRRLFLNTLIAVLLLSITFFLWQIMMLVLNEAIHGRLAGARAGTRSSAASSRYHTPPREIYRPPPTPEQKKQDGRLLRAESGWLSFRAVQYRCGQSGSGKCQLMMPVRKESAVDMPADIELIENALN